MRAFSLLLFATVSCMLGIIGAEHHTCDWGGPGANPEDGQYRLYCTGKKENDDVFTADYVCRWDNGRVNKVADYGKLLPSVLEFATPCAGGGYTADCVYIFWGICLGSRNATGSYEGGCRFMYAYDDCQWPTVIKEVDKPAAVDIWRWKPSRAGEMAAGKRG